jgi:hypothetical protein
MPAYEVGLKKRLRRLRLGRRLRGRELVRMDEHDDWDDDDYDEADRAHQRGLWRGIALAVTLCLIILLAIGGGAFATHFYLQGSKVTDRSGAFAQRQTNYSYSRAQDTWKPPTGDASALLPIQPGIDIALARPTSQCTPAA